MALLFPHLRANASRFPAHVRAVLASHAPAAEELLQAYGVSAGPVDDEVGFRAFLDMATDVSYYAATVSFARGWGAGGSCRAFFLNERNSGDGPYRGEATHTFDAVLLFQNFNDGLPPAVRGAARAFARDVLAFANGTGGGKGVKVYGPSSWDEGVTEPAVEIVDDVVSEGAGRRKVVIDVGERVGLDTLASVVGSFIAS